jgi:branched-chain amino acid transport system substrate-binding protein
MRLARRQFLRLSAATVSMTSLGLLPGAAGAETAIKIGIVNSFSGFLAAPGDEMQKGIEPYAKTHMAQLPTGVGIQLIKRDDGSSPEVGKRVAQELITREKVNLLLGVVGSPIATAIAPLTVDAKVPLILTNAAGVSIPRLSPYVARVSFTQWQTTLPTECRESS